VTYTTEQNGNGEFLPYLRTPGTFSRPWAVPGTPGLEHRVGGLEKDSVTGNISYVPDNHQLMTDTRAWKVANIANDIPELEVFGDEDADVLVVGWGSTLGSIRAAGRRVRLAGEKVASIHLRHLNPFPKNLGEILERYPKILVPEMNSGQLHWMLRAAFLKDTVAFNQVTGEPFKVGDITEKILEMIKS